MYIVISVEWCRWAGIKRIFHWDNGEGQFKCVKVWDDAEHYRTQADSRRLIERMVQYALHHTRRHLIFLLAIRMIFFQHLL